MRAEPRVTSAVKDPLTASPPAEEATARGHGPLLKHRLPSMMLMLGLRPGGLSIFMRQCSMSFLRLLPSGAARHTRKLRFARRSTPAVCSWCEVKRRALARQ
jgi:hypothetical protein